MSISQTRVQAGIPTGGQFSQSLRDESGVSLADLADSFLDEFDTDDTFDPAGHDAVSRAVDNAYASARHWESRKGVRERSRGVMDVDDMAQEGMLAVLERQANGQVIDDSKAYAHTVIWGIANQAGNLAVRQEDRKALKMFNQAVDRKASSLGRRLTPSEEDQVATAIRNNWHDQRRKPSEDFRRYAGQMEVSMDASESDSAADYFMPHAPAADAEVRSVNDIAPGSFKDRALDAIEGHGGDLRDARRMLWNALAEDGAAPMVQAGTLSQRKVTSTRSDMAAYPGGVTGALDAWERGENNSGTEALFAPWATTDEATRDQVVNQMRRFPGRSEDLWDSALKLANNRNADRP